MVELRKPPVIEAWVEFRFSVGEGVPAWDEEQAKSFVEKHFGEHFTVKDFVGHYELQLDAGPGRPHVRETKAVFERARAVNAQGDRYVQVGRDVLIYNMLRSQGAWPTYEALRHEAMGAYATYAQHAQPQALRTVTLHYRDVVQIPLGTERKVELSEYLTVHPDVPETTFGPAAGLSITLALPQAARHGALTLVICDEPSGAPGTPPDVARFRLDWHLTSGIIESMERPAVQAWLDEAHEDLVKAFRSCMTERGWRLFEPEED